MEKENKIEELKDKVSDVFENIAEKVGEGKEEKKKKVKPLVSSRVLFVTVLDKIYFIIFVLSFIGSVLGISLFRTSYSVHGASYFSTLFSIILSFVGVAIAYVIGYFIINWFYKCMAKTMICLTKKEIYGEVYAPFFRGEFSIPVDKVTKIDTVKVLWIFRTLIIHRYHQIPIVFATWNAQEFKDKWTELVADRDDKVENEFETRSIMPAWLKKKWYIVLIAFAAILLLSIISFTIDYLDNPLKKVPGAYSYDDQGIVLNEDGSCQLINVIDDEVTSCSWYAREDYDDINVTVNYEYRYKSSWSNRYYNSSSSKIFTFDEDDEELESGYITYTKSIRIG